MIRINLITVGKLKEKYWRDAAAEYSKRLGAFCKLEIVELNESRLSDNPSEKEIAAALENEAKAMKCYTDIKGAYNIAMCIEGKQLSSEKLSKKAQRMRSERIQHSEFHNRLVIRHCP